MWIETDKGLQDKIFTLRDADKLLSWGKLLFYGGEYTVRDLDLSIECFIRAAEYKEILAIHFLYFINDANAALPADALRIKQLLSKIDPYEYTVRMQVVQAGKDLHQLISNDAVNSQYWQRCLDRLRSAAEKKDSFAMWELALHYMVGRGCRQNCELAKQYATEACKAYPVFKAFISEFCFSAKVPSLQEVLDNPKLLSCPTVEEMQDQSKPSWRRAPASFRILYPELFIKGIFAPSAVFSQVKFAAVWPEFYHLFDWETFHTNYHWWRRSIPYWLLMHQPKFAELIPINWAMAKQDDIYLVFKHQKFERYIRPEQFSQDAFRKVLHRRPEYARFADMQNITGHKLANDIQRKVDLHPLQPEDRILARIFESPPHEKIPRWMRSIERHCGIPDLFKQKLDEENLSYLHGKIDDIYFEQIQKYLNQ